ncbi:MAG TPA: hypothetical protein VF865_21710 [Acidobacteriaceae bacterium]
MRVLVLCLIASLAVEATAQTRKPVGKPSAASAKPATADAKPAHFSAAGLNNEDDLLRIYSGDFQSIHLDHDGSEFMLIISGYMEDFARDCKQFLPPNKVEITQQVCASTPYTPYSPDGVHDVYGNVIQTSAGCTSYQTVGTGLFADPQLYDAVKDVSAKAQLHLVQNMLGVATGKGGRAANPFTISQQIVDQLTAVGTEMQTLIHTNACGSPGLKNFQSNLIRFASGQAPVKYAGAVVTAPVAVLPGVRDADFTRLLDDLVSDNALGWTMNRYQPGSISDPIVSHDPLGNPVRIIARFRYVGSQSGRVTVSFKDGVPDCLYFSDAPDNCHVPSQRVISAYQKNAYARYTAAEARQSPFADGCNTFMRDPKTSRYAPRDPEGYCQCLSNGYQKVMTPAEETFYGKNFEDKFWRGIAQPRSDDPAWPRLNPIALSCMQ